MKIIIPPTGKKTAIPPKGTKRTRGDELVQVMNTWYKQENDALHVENRKLKKRQKLLDLRNRVCNDRLEVLREQLVAVRQESAFREAIIHEIFANWPEVHEQYTRPLEAEEQLDDEETETEYEEEELDRPESS